MHGTLVRLLSTPNTYIYKYTLIQQVEAARIVAADDYVFNSKMISLANYFISHLVLLLLF